MKYQPKKKPHLFTIKVSGQRVWGFQPELDYHYESQKYSENDRKAKEFCDRKNLEAL